MRRFGGFEKISSPSYWKGPSNDEVSGLVTEVLNKCARTHKPAWITVPQVPLADSTERNKINRMMALASGRWKSSSDFTGRLILPLVMTHQDQVKGKTARNRIVAQAKRCYDEAQADGFWVVDQSLAEDKGSASLKNARVSGILLLHEELNDCISSKIRIAGPYWGLNLVLWAKGLVDYPAIGVGSGYRYFLAGGHARKPRVRIALAPLRRRVNLAQELKTWLDEVTAWLDEVAVKLGPAHPANAEFGALRRRLTALSDYSTARYQVAEFYKTWFNIIASEPKAARPMALFQDLSAAYALGKSLPDLKGEEGPSRRPEAVAEPLMLSCL
jgi:hypothetical protein